MGVKTVRGAVREKMRPLKPSRAVDPFNWKCPAEAETIHPTPAKNPPHFKYSIPPSSIIYKGPREVSFQVQTSSPISSLTCKETKRTPAAYTDVLFVLKENLTKYGGRERMKNVPM